MFRPAASAPTKAISKNSHTQTFAWPLTTLITINKQLHQCLWMIYRLKPIPALIKIYKDHKLSFKLDL